MSSERVEKHALDAWIDNAWQEVATGTNIGYKRILRFPDVTSNKFRLRILESRMKPAICQVAAYHYAARPPRLEVKRNTEGNVTISTMQQKFGWKTYTQDIARNLNAGFKIHYTTDGSTPTAESKEYTQPFALESGMVKAVALLNNEKGEVCQQQLGYLKKEWKIKQERPTVVTLQANRPYSISGLMYTPQINDAMPMSVKGSVKFSENGKDWILAETFEFGNLKNDPTCRYHYFKKPAKARYIRIEANEKITKDAIEYDLF